VPAPASSSHITNSCNRNVVEKGPLLDPRSDARDITKLFAHTRSRNPAVWTGFFIVPSPLTLRIRPIIYTKDCLKPDFQGRGCPSSRRFREVRLDEPSLRRVWSGIYAEALHAESGHLGEGMTLGIGRL